LKDSDVILATNMTECSW